MRRSNFEKVKQRYPKSIELMVMANLCLFTITGCIDHAHSLLDEIDERVCEPGQFRFCGTNEGVCEEVREICPEDGMWRSCEGMLLQRDEICGDEIDNDCNGEVDELEECHLSACERGCPPWSECDGGQCRLNETYLKASLTQEDAKWGASVNIHEGRMVVGAPSEGIDSSGAAYVFEKNPFGTWFLAGRLVAHNGESLDEFGTSVNVWGDWVVVGAPGESSGGQDQDADGSPDNNNLAQHSGAAYVFRRTVDDQGQIHWQQVAFLKGSSVEVGDAFGVSVSMHEDLIAVGVNQGRRNLPVEFHGGGEAVFDDPREGVGRVDIFRKQELAQDRTVWTLVDSVEASDGAPGDRFGSSVSLHANRVAVGAPQKTNERGYALPGEARDLVPVQLYNSGAAYVFEMTESEEGAQEWIEVESLRAFPHLRRESQFGASVSLWNDTVVIGSPRESYLDPEGRLHLNVWRAGAAYVFEREVDPDGRVSWFFSDHLMASNTSEQSFFGADVQHVGDQLVIGAHCESSPGEDRNHDGLPDLFSNHEIEQVQPDHSHFNPHSGAAYVFERSENEEAWQQSVFIKASNLDRSDHFGATVSLDFDGTVVVGAPGESSISRESPQDNTVPSSGAVYVYER